jgi:hypothetical protein
MDFRSVAKQFARSNFRRSTFERIQEATNPEFLTTIKLILCISVLFPPIPTPMLAYSSHWSEILGVLLLSLWKKNKNDGNAISASLLET